MMSGSKCQRMERQTSPFLTKKLASSKDNKRVNCTKYAKIAKEKFPDDPAIMDTLGLAYYKKQLYGNAVGEFSESLKSIPDNPIVHYHLGLAYNKKGDVALSKKELSKALELNNKFPGAQKAQTLLAELNKG